MDYPKIAIIYLSYNPRPYIDRVIKSLSKTTYKKEQLEFIVVDNPHSEFGSAEEFLKEKLLPLSIKELPKITIIANKENLGFAKGNNVGIKYAIDNGFDYVFLHNQDGFMGLDMLDRVINVFKMEPNTGIVQPLIMLYPEHNLINTSGNKFHYLGFGYSGEYKLEIKNHKLKTNSKEVAYCSGAGMMIRSSLLKKYGLLDEDFFMYHEDLELGLRLKSVGFKNMLASSARFYHEYEFSKNLDAFYLMERNRWMVVLMYYKWRTLFLFMPMFLLMEVGLIPYSVVNGWGKQKFRAIGYWLMVKNWKKVMKKRKEIQKNRRITDLELLKLATFEIKFEGIDNYILKCLGNPIMKAGFWVAKRLIFW